MKSLEEIEYEMRCALARRRIQTVSICGGEPTLHPRLPEIVAHLHGRKLKTALITNGLLLDDARMLELKKAGLDIVMLHIDEGQRRPDLPFPPSAESIDRLRSVLAQKASAHGLDVGLSVTFYPDSLPRLAPLIQYLLESKDIHFLFATNYVDIESLVSLAHRLRQKKDDQPGRNKRVAPQIANILKDCFGLEPFAFLPYEPKAGCSSDCPEWFTYFIPVLYFDHGSQKFLMRSRRSDVVPLLLSKLLSGKFLFYCKQNSLATAIQVALNAWTTRRAKEGARFLGKLFHKGTVLRGKRLVFENGPLVTDRGEIACCVCCPNATVRDGKLVHVCLADHLLLEDAKP